MKYNPNTGEMIVETDQDWIVFKNVHEWNRRKEERKEAQFQRKKAEFEAECRRMEYRKFHQQFNTIPL